MSMTATASATAGTTIIVDIGNRGGMVDMTVANAGATVTMTTMGGRGINGGATGTMIPDIGVVKDSKAEIVSAKTGLAGPDRALMPISHARPAVNAARL